MTAFLVFTEGDPLIVATPKKVFEKGELSKHLSRVGVNQFIAHEIDIDLLREVYGFPFEVVEDDVRNGKGLRVLDSNGTHAVAMVDFDELGPGIAHGL